MAPTTFLKKLYLFFSVIQKQSRVADIEPEQLAILLVDGDRLF
jgi:hypothetical protein